MPHTGDLTAHLPFGRGGLFLGYVYTYVQLKNYREPRKLIFFEVPVCVYVCVCVRLMSGIRTGLIYSFSLRFMIHYVELSMTL